LEVRYVTSKFAKQIVSAVSTVCASVIAVNSLGEEAFYAGKTLLAEPKSVVDVCIGLGAAMFAFGLITAGAPNERIRPWLSASWQSVLGIDIAILITVLLARMHFR
jgi:hypothetical protein